MEAVLHSLREQWQDTPPSWDDSGDPCGSKWEGIICTGDRQDHHSNVFRRLSTIGLKGGLSGDIGGLTELQSLILAGCGFTGNIPVELGNLSALTFLSDPTLVFRALNLNNLTGTIPPSLGGLSNLYWLDIADNQLTGTIPVSTSTQPGLDQLHHAKHFHFNRNKLSGSIPAKLFSSDMVLIHIRLDRNSLKGSVPSLSNLTELTELHLANNELTGPLPDLRGMDRLNYVYVSALELASDRMPLIGPEQQFVRCIGSSSLVLDLTISYYSSHGVWQTSRPTPTKAVQLPPTTTSNNAINGTFSMGENISPQLQLVDLEYNNISIFAANPNYKNTLELFGNPFCNSQFSNYNYCRLLQSPTRPYSTNLANCAGESCPADQKPSPQSCYCSYPYTGTLYFRAPLFSDLTNSTTFQSLEMKMWTVLGLPPGSVSLQNPFFNTYSYLQVNVELFPPSGKYFNRSEILRIGFDLVNQTFKPPSEFGPYYFVAEPYVFQASWGPTGTDSGGAPQLKGARWFAYDDLKKSTNNFSETHEIGFGGYGRVYQGVLPGGQVVAIKRARQGSMQGGVEFKTEIELLSRVHHKNLVGLVGFCFEQGEQMLVYEYVPNRTLRENLSGRSGVHLDWKRRLRIALGSARGLAYLHELADPPIIHRDVKSTNILLDENLTAKVSDFGLSKLASDCGKGHVSTQVKGTLGYLDPEYYMTQQLTDKSDVYSFGVVMLELVTAKQPIEKGKYIVREVRMAIDKNDEYYGLSEVMDPSIRSATNLAGFGRFVELAMRCLDDSAAERPTMSDVVKEIEIILQNDGMNTNSTSASSSATDFGSMKAALRHPYNETLYKKDDSSESFDYSGGYTLSAKVEPK
ncbi:hypothetical protein ACLOJK_031598 [Asimina triloba]